ncbi:hypothetical protein EV421DRAFT_1830735 [Armillaria borealis]|uniref:Uncharacterized protein n=1 Tax=Armillaria borealis TaxID=47425 RepID=A0AA39J783_9AGAR|nr:hypothetical protein EV421DRAFT_1830735 [Armillaria borealis]
MSRLVLLPLFHPVSIRFSASLQKRTPEERILHHVGLVYPYPYKYYCLCFVRNISRMPVYYTTSWFIFNFMSQP